MRDGAATSMSTPIVSGAAALLLSKEPDMTNEEVKKCIQMTATDLHLPRNQQGFGLLNVEKNAEKFPSLPSPGLIPSHWASSSKYQQAGLLVRPSLFLLTIRSLTFHYRSVLSGATDPRPIRIPWDCSSASARNRRTSGGCRTWPSIPVPCPPATHLHNRWGYLPPGGGQIS